MSDRLRLIVGVSGASGSLYALHLLRALRRLEVESHLIMSRSAEVTLAYESSLKVQEVKDLASVVHAYDNLAAAPSSGSFRTLGMVVAPCSVRSLAEIAQGSGGNLLTRAADVCLKERRRLVLMVRETPLHLGHIRNMAAVTEMGGIIAPPVPAFYAKPQSLEEMVEHTISRVLDLFGLEPDRIRRWGEDGGCGPVASLRRD